MTELSSKAIAGTTTATNNNEEEATAARFPSLSNNTAVDADSSSLVSRQFVNHMLPASVGGDHGFT